jgi:hypothetical protein
MNSPTQPTVAKSMRMEAVQVMAKNAVPLSASNPIDPPFSLMAFVALKMMTVAIADAILRLIKPTYD